MRLHRFYLEQKIDLESEIIVTDSDLIHQLVNVFRFKTDDHLIVFDETGFESEAKIISVNHNKIILGLLKDQKKTLPINTSDDHHNFVSLYLSLIKKNNFEWAAEKCTEIGVAEIHPIISERSEKKDLNMIRLHKIVKEASEQSGRNTLPRILDITDLSQAVSQAIMENKFCIAFHTGEINCDAPTAGEDNRSDFQTTPAEHNRHSSHHLPSLTQDSSLEKEEISGSHGVAVFIGPEGGWTENEIKLFRENNFQICSLGHNILRAETAAITAVWEAFHR